MLIHECGGDYNSVHYMLAFFIKYDFRKLYINVIQHSDDMTY